MCGPREGQTTSDTPYLIFVTGIPSKTTCKEVLDHFGRFGRVQMYRLPATAKCQRVLQNHASVNIKRGFCILQVASEITYQQILGSSEHFQGRSLAIGPFRQGSALWTHNEHVTCRRVIIKKVPSAVSEEILRRALETDFGAITRMYRFAAESSLKAVKREKSRKTNTYSIEFVQESAALLAAQDSQYFLNGLMSPLIIEKFVKKSSPIGDESSQNDSTYKSSKKQKNTNNLKSSLFTGGQNCQSAQQKSLPISAADYEYHNCKPTNKQYHLDRETYSTDSSDEQTSNYQVRLSSRRSRSRPRFFGAYLGFNEGNGLHLHYSQTAYRYY